MYVWGWFDRWYLRSTRRHLRTCTDPQCRAEDEGVIARMEAQA